MSWHKMYPLHDSLLKAKNNHVRPGSHETKIKSGSGAPYHVGLHLISFEETFI